MPTQAFTTQAITTEAKTKIAAFALAVLTSVSVLGAVTAGMQPQAQMQLVALDAVTVTAAKIN